MSGSRAIVFDLDDTLYPERSYVRSGFAAVGDWIERRLGLPAGEVASELSDLHEAGARGDTFDRWLERRGLAASGLVAPMVEAYRGHRPAIRPFDETPGLLDRLGGPFRLGLVTDGYRQVQRLKLEALGLAECFDAVVLSDELGREAWKPSPRPFEAVLERLGVRARDAAYVADNPLKDFVAPRALGMRTIRVRWPGGYHASDLPPSPDHAPDKTVEDLGPLEEFLSERWP